jgi:hypothetical protein
LSIGGDRVDFREHRLSSFLGDDFHGAVIYDSHADRIPVATLRNLLVVSIGFNLGKYTAGFCGSCVESESMTQVPSKGLCVADPDCDRSTKTRSIFMQIAFRAVQQLVFYGKLV